MPTTPERFPTDAERHVIASAFVDPAWLSSARDELTPRHFCEPVHAAIWDAILATTKPGEQADELTVTAHLRAQGDLDRVGGASAVNTIASTLYTPSPSAAKWQRAVVDAHRSRILRDGLERLVQQADSGAFNTDELASQARALSESAAPGDAARRARPSRHKVRDLLSFDRKADPTCVFGNRWLCRGSSCLLVAQSGVGKSSFINGAVTHWALDRDYFGMKSKVGPLRSLVIGAENDFGDTAEPLQDTLHGMGISLASQNIVDALEDRLAFHHESIRTGEDFGRHLTHLIREHRADVTIIDPMLAFSGCDLTAQDELSHWTRGILQRVIEETNTILICVHHTTKPRPKEAQAVMNFDNLSYLGAGGSDLTNWVRACLILEKDLTDEAFHDLPFYHLIAAKRGGRAGLKDSQGNFTRRVPLRHAKEPGVVRWEHRVEAADSERSLREASRRSNPMQGSHP